jgi:NTE family protein
MKQTLCPCDAVFEGGGMRGIGLVGAIYEFEKNGYLFRNVAGSSAGAIIAALIASGYSAEEIRAEMENVNFDSFRQPASGINLGPLTSLFNVTRNLGLYRADLFESWMTELLARKGVHTFADLRKGSLRVTASDVTEEKGLVLPDDLVHFDVNPENFSVATAVRMSMGIPLFYEPYELVDKKGVTHYIVDGGMLCNYPIWILDNGIKKIDAPVFGFRFAHVRGGNKSTSKPNMISYIKQLVTTFIEANGDNTPTVVRGDRERTIAIDTRVNGVPVGITDFGISRDQIQTVFENGRAAATQFLSTWDFKKWQKTFRR